jgi:prepilin-type N-terminal cleavage/methylation domain-containing protein
MKNAKGFTLVEFLLAIVVFSFILILMATAFIQVNRSYNKGLTVRRVHQSARDIIADVSRTFLSNTGSLNSLSLTKNAQEICIGTKVRYLWSVGTVDRSANYGMMRDTQFSSCGEGLPGDVGEVELLDDNVVVQNFDISQIGTSGSYRITVTLSSNTSDLVTGDGSGGVECSVGAGDQFCDIVTLETTVSVRE